MSKKSQRLHLFLFLTVPTVAVITVILRAVALLTVYDPVARYFDATSLSIAGTALLVAVAAVLAILTHELRDLFVFTADYRDLPTLFSGIFTAIALLFFGVTTVIGAATSKAAVLALAILVALAALGGAAHFILHAFGGGAVGTAKAMTALPCAALGLFYALYLYFEDSMMINDPAKVLSQCTFCVAIFFFLGEARIALGRAKWALHTYMTVMTAILSATLAIPNLIYHAVAGEPLLGNTVHDFLALALFLYTLARLATVLLAHTREAMTETQYVTDFAVAKKAADEPTDNEKDASHEETADR